MRPVPLVALDLPADATAPRRARRAIAPVVAEIGADTAGITLAVSEAVTNAVTHGYRERPAGRVRLCAERDERSVVVVVEDDGAGMTDAGDRGRHGLGMPTIETLAQELVVDSGAAGTRVVMRFGLPA